MSLLAEWSSYALGDFLMYAPETWWRLQHRYQLAIWPMQLPALALGLLLLWQGLKPGTTAGRWPWLLLGLGWGWVSWAFLLRHYAEISLAAPGFAAAFGLQALLLGGLGLLRQPPRFRPDGPAGRVGAMLLLFAVLAWPLLALFGGQGWAGMGFFLLHPEPTTLGSLGLALMLAGPRRLLLAIVPLLWLYFSALSQLAMASSLGTPLLALTLLGNLALLLPSRPKPKDLSSQRRRGAEEA